MKIDGDGQKVYLIDDRRSETFSVRLTAARGLQAWQVPDSDLVSLNPTRIFEFWDMSKKLERYVMGNIILLVRFKD